MAASVPAGDQTLWADATSFISAVCQELDPGELVHGENFSLFESMAALEIMDPKMDGGMDIGGPKSVEDAISLGLAPVDLNVSQMIDVMDHLLSCEATWHRGHSLAQTVFSSIYMLKLELTVSMPYLYAYCKLTRATCNIARAAVLLAHTHEEEEIFGMAFGLPVSQNDGDCLAVFSLAEEVCARRRKKLDAQEPEALECQCVLSRLRFRKALYQALLNMDKPQGRGLETARKHIAAALSELSAIRDSTEFLNSSQKQGDGLSPTTGSGRAPLGFNENINRSLLPPTPPRSMKLLQWSEVLDYFEKLLRDLDRVCLVPLNLELEPLLELIVDFQKSHPDLLARSRMQLLVVQDNKLFGSLAMPDVIYKTMFLSCQPAPRDAAMEKFLQQASWLLGTLLKILCANPAWQCRKLGKILDDWNNLFQLVETLFEASAEVNEKNLKEVPIVTWIACQASWITCQYLSMGFDLELYSVEEYCMIYWYLDHALLTLMQYTLEREELSNQEARKKVEVLQDSSSAKKKPNKKKKGGGGDKGRSGGKEQGRTGPGKDGRASPKLVYLQCLSDLCKAYMWMFIALKNDNKLSSCPLSSYTTEQERYQQRFELLQGLLVPSAVSFQSFRQATRFRQYSVRDVVEHLEFVEQSLRVAATEKIKGKEIRELEKVIARNKKALRELQPGDSIMSLEFAQHPYFGVLLLKNSHKASSSSSQR